jgi:hypothetical protein
MSRLRRGEVGSGDDAGYRGGHDELDRGATSAWRGGAVCISIVIMLIYVFY